jgi:hypothetical protein
MLYQPFGLNTPSLSDRNRRTAIQGRKSLPTTSGPLHWMWVSLTQELCTQQFRWSSESIWSGQLRYLLGDSLATAPETEW